MSATSSLWGFASGLYERSGVSEALLGLQDDSGLDIPLFLFLLWADYLGKRYTPVEVEKLAALAAEISRNLIQPVRASRRWLKANHPDDSINYRLLLEAELSCEKKLLDALERQSDTSLPGEMPMSATGTANVERYLDCAGISRNGENGDRLAVVFKEFHRLTACDFN